MSDWLSTDDQSAANSKIDQILELIEKKDKDTLETLFSKQAIDESKNIDNSIDELFNFFQGDFISYDDWGAVNTEETIDDGNRKKILYSTYDIKTTDQTYRIAIKDITNDTTNTKSVGIYSFYIIKLQDDSYPHVAYRGDQKYTPGINFNVKSLPLT